jgi:hypothetical protein
MSRVTRKQVDEQAETLTALLGVRIIVRGAYGGYGVFRIHPETGNSEDDLMSGYQTMREVNRFLSGMLATLSIQRRLSEGR